MPKPIRRAPGGRRPQPRGNALTLLLCPTANAPVAANSVLGDVTQIAYTNLSTRVLDVASSAQVAGLYKLVITDHILTASGGAVAAFRYVGIYNDTPTSPADPLIGWYDYGSSLVLGDTESLTVDFDGAVGVLTLA